MDENMKLWLDWEMKDFSGVFQEFNKKLMKNVPLWMALSVIAMVGLGFLTGGAAANVFMIHFPIGCGIALIIWFCFWQQARSVSMDKVRAAYEKAMEEFFQSGEEKKAFTRQMDTNNYGRINLMNTVSNKYPSRFIAGESYWVMFRDLNCSFVRTADIGNVSGREEQTSVRYNTGSNHVRQGVAVGMSLVIRYKDDAASALGKKEEIFYMENREQYEQVIAMIKKYCPQSKEFIS